MHGWLIQSCFIYVCVITAAGTCLLTVNLCVSACLHPLVNYPGRLTFCVFLRLTSLTFSLIKCCNCNYNLAIAVKRFIVVSTGHSGLGTHVLITIIMARPSGRHKSYSFPWDPGATAAQSVSIFYWATKIQAKLQRNALAITVELYSGLNSASISLTFATINRGIL